MNDLVRVTSQHTARLSIMYSMAYTDERRGRVLALVHEVATKFEIIETSRVTEYSTGFSVCYVSTDLWRVTNAANALLGRLARMSIARAVPVTEVKS